MYGSASCGLVMLLKRLPLIHPVIVLVTSITVHAKHTDYETHLFSFSSFLNSDANSKAKEMIEKHCASCQINSKQTQLQRLASKGKHCYVQSVQYSYVSMSAMSVQLCQYISAASAAGEVKRTGRRRLEKMNRTKPSSKFPASGYRCCAWWLARQAIRPF